MRTGCNLRYIRFPLRPRPRSAIRCLRAVISLCPRGARTSFDIDYRVPYALLRVVCRGRRRVVVRPTFCCRVMSLATPSSSTGIPHLFRGRRWISCKPAHRVGTGWANLLVQLGVCTIDLPWLISPKGTINPHTISVGNYDTRDRWPIFVQKSDIVNWRILLMRKILY